MRDTQPDWQQKNAKIRILIVDDSAVFRKVLARYIASLPRLELVGECADGKEALVMARTLLPELVLMEMEMSGMNGLVTAQLVRHARPSTRVVLVSLHDREQLTALCLDHGVDRFVPKDRLCEELPDVIEELFPHVGSCGEREDVVLS